MRIKNVHHIAINTRDISESIKFYEDVLGLERGETVEFEDFTLVYFNVFGGGKLELFDYRGKDLCLSKKNEMKIGLRHIAFEVENILDYEKKLRKKGVKIVLPLTTLPQIGSKVLLFVDPNDVTIELCEPLG